MRAFTSAWASRLRANSPGGNGPVSYMRFRPLPTMVPSGAARTAPIGIVRAPSASQESDSAACQGGSKSPHVSAWPFIGRECVEPARFPRRRSAQCERDDARRNQTGERETPCGIALVEQKGPHQGREDDAELPGGRDVADGCAYQGRENEDIRERREHCDSHGLEALGTPCSL